MSGFTDHVVATACADVPLMIRFEREGETEINAFKSIIQELFLASGKSIPNLSNRVTIGADQGY